MLRCEGRPAGYVRTTEDDLNFELTLEWRFDPARGVIAMRAGREEVFRLEPHRADSLPLDYATFERRFIAPEPAAAAPADGEVEASGAEPN